MGVDFATVVMTDGRDDMLARAIESLEDRLIGRAVHRIIHDDTGSVEHREQLVDRFPGWNVAGADRRMGFGGAYAHAHEHVRQHVVEPFVFMTEDDFVLHRDVDVDAMAEVLTAHPHIVQMACRRQAWNGAEIEAGGVVETRPHKFIDCDDGAGHHWLQHREFFTTNPSLMRLATFFDDPPWPNVVGSEVAYSALLLDAHPERCAAYWEARTEPPLAWHIGKLRHPKGTRY